MWLSAVWYDVGYDILSLNMVVCFEILIVFGQSMPYKVFFSFIAAKSRTVTRFFLVLIILVS